MHQDHKRWATRTFTVPIDPNRPGQFLTADYRFVLGGSIEKYTRWALPHDMVSACSPAPASDTTPSTANSSIRRNPVRPTADVNFQQTNPFAYTQLDFKPASWVKLTGGFRYGSGRLKESKPHNGVRICFP